MLGIGTLVHIGEDSIAIEVRTTDGVHVKTIGGAWTLIGIIHDTITITVPLV